MDKTPTNSGDTTPTNSRRSSLDKGSRSSNEGQSSKNIKDYTRHAFNIQETGRASWVQGDEKHSQKPPDDPWEEGRETEHPWIDLSEDFSQLHITETFQHTEQENASQRSNYHLPDENKFIGMVSQHFKDTQEPDQSDWTSLRRKVEYIEQLYNMFSSPEASSTLREMWQSQSPSDKHSLELGDSAKIQEAKKFSQNSLIKGIRSWEIYGSQGSKHLFILDHIEKKLNEIDGLLYYYRNNCTHRYSYILQAIRENTDLSLSAFLHEGSFQQGLQIAHKIITNHQGD